MLNFQLAKNRPVETFLFCAYFCYSVFFLSIVLCHITDIVFAFVICSYHFCLLTCSGLLYSLNTELLGAQFIQKDTYGNLELQNFDRRLDDIIIKSVNKNCTNWHDCLYFINKTEVSFIHFTTSNVLSSDSTMMAILHYFIITVTVSDTVHLFASSPLTFTERIWRDKTVFFTVFLFLLHISLIGHREHFMPYNLNVIRFFFLFHLHIPQ